MSRRPTHALLCVASPTRALLCVAPPAHALLCPACAPLTAASPCPARAPLVAVRPCPAHPRHPAVLACCPAGCHPALVYLCVALLTAPPTLPCLRAALLLARPTASPAMATLSVLSFDAEGHPIQFDAWLDDLQLYLLSDSRDSVSLFDLTSGASFAPSDTSDSATRSQWLTRDAAARLAVRNHLPLAERAHFGQHKTTRAMYDALVARYSSQATAALGRLILPYLFPELSAFATVADLVTHLRTSDTRYRATLPTEFLAKNPPPMYIMLYYIVTRLPDSLCAVRDLLLALEPTDLIVDLLEKHLLAAETSIVAVGASRGTPRTPFFEGCSPSPFVPYVASAASVDFLHAEEVGVASAPSGRRRSGSGKGARVVEVAMVEVAVVAVGVEALVAAVVTAVGVVAAAVVAAVGAVAGAVVAVGLELFRGKPFSLAEFQLSNALKKFLLRKTAEGDEFGADASKGS
ncbi:unnamed protein product [Closterium sp. NIES-54]